jgi:hypothetical protein
MRCRKRMRDMSWHNRSDLISRESDEMDSWLFYYGGAETLSRLRRNKIETVLARTVTRIDQRKFTAKGISKFTFIFLPNFEAYLQG